jgi:toxin ParE1/3/4
VSRSLIVSATARKDLNQIWDYIAHDSPDAADRVLNEIEAAMLRLCEMPTVGHQRKDVKDETLRFRSVYSYIIAYRHTRNRLMVARVVSGHRDFKKLFR